MLIDARSGYHGLYLNEKSSYLTFSCQFGAAPAADAFQRKIDEIFRELLNIIGIADDILIVAYDYSGGNQDRTLHIVLQIYRKVKCPFRHYYSIFWRIYFRAWCTTKPTQAASIHRNAITKIKERITFLGIMNYLSKFSPMTA